MMPSPLRLNTVIALAYVALGTLLVLINQQADAPPQGAPMAASLAVAASAAPAQ